MSLPTLEDELLLLCARIELDPAGRRRLRQLAAAGLDWEHVIAWAIRQGIPTLVYHHLSGLEDGTTARQAPAAGSETGAPRPWAVLEQTYRLAQLQAMRQRFELLRLLDALQGAGVEAIVLKGLALREIIYPDPALRPSGDVDLLVRLAAVPIVEAALQGLGYEPDETVLPREWWRPDNIHHLVPYHLPEREVQVEVHWDLAMPRNRLAIDIDGVWSRAQTTLIAGRPVRALDPVDLVVHLGLHFAAVSLLQTGLRHLVDVAEVARHFESRLDWPEVAARAASWKAWRYVYLVLCLARELLDAPVPAAALQQLRPEGFDDRVVAFARERLLMAARPGDPELVTKNLTGFLFEDRGAGRVRRLWSSFFPPRERMAHLYGIPLDSPRLVGYYFVRPFQLFGRYAPLLADAILGSKKNTAELGRKKRELLLDRWLAPL